MKEVIFVTVVSLVCRVFGRGTWNASGQYEYYVSPGGDSRPYDDAPVYCNGQGGELALVKTQEVQQFIQSLVADNSGQPYGFFIGLRDIGANGTFVWNDGEALRYTNWITGEPNNIGSETCVIMGWIYIYQANLPWYNVQCTTGANGPRGFVCQRQIAGKSWGEWQSWGICSSTCEPGEQRRERLCVDSGREGIDGCQGNNLDAETRPCGTNLCTSYSEGMINCNGTGQVPDGCLKGKTWAKWQSWGICSSTCEPGEQRRERICVNSGREGIDGCQGNNLDAEIGKCSTDLQWKYNDNKLTCKQSNVTIPEECFSICRYQMKTEATTTASQEINSAMTSLFTITDDTTHEPVIEKNQFTFDGTSFAIGFIVPLCVLIGIVIFGTVKYLQLTEVNKLLSRAESNKQQGNNMNPVYENNQSVTGDGYESVTIGTEAVGSK